MKNIKKAIISTVFGSLVLVGTAIMASAQVNNSREYRDWQRAQVEAQQRQADWQRSQSQSDWRQWQKAQARAQQMQAAYQQRYGSTYNNGYNNNGYSNNNGNHYGWNTQNNRNRYRVYNNGQYYSTDQRGAELLRQAVRNGYSEGYRQGMNDRRTRRSSGYNGNSYYNNGSNGYQSYVDRGQYQYYYQQGFQKGYEDGYNSRNQYGSRSGSSYNILGSVLNTILNLTN